MKPEFTSKWFKRLHGSIISIALSVLVAVVSAISFFGTGAAAAATSQLPIQLVYYGTYTAVDEQRIIDAQPEFLVSASAIGPRKGNADISKFMAAGIKYLEYIDVAYEGKYPKTMPYDLPSNLNYIAAIAKAGAWGVFVDEVSDDVYTPADYNYLQQIADKAHSLGLKVVFNTGSFAWSDRLMTYADYIGSTETWSNEPLTPSQSKWASRTWLLKYAVNDSASAASITTGASSKGICSQYTTLDYLSLPVWFEDYISRLRAYLGIVPSSLPSPASTASSMPTPPAPTPALTPDPTTPEPGISWWLTMGMNPETW